MNRFIVRITLHHANEADYYKLHNAMDLKGFRRMIIDVDGKWYHLPFAEYYVEVEATIERALHEAKGAAASTGHQFSVLVTHIYDYTGYGLTPVT